MESLKAAFHNAIDTVIDNKNHLLVLLLASLGIAGGVMLYQGYRHRVETHAHKALNDAMKYFDGEVRGQQKKAETDLEAKFFESNEDKWTKTAAAFHDAYEKNSSASLAGMFIAFESESYVRLGDLKKAIELLRSALQLMKQSQVKQMYNLKLALILMDCADEKERNEGLALLQSIANDNADFAQETALYRLGEYHWVKKQFDDAKNYWGQLTHKFGEKNEADKFVSVWAEQAHGKLKLIQ